MNKNRSEHEAFAATHHEVLPARQALHLPPGSFAEGEQRRHHHPPGRVGREHGWCLRRRIRHRHRQSGSPSRRRGSRQCGWLRWWLSARQGRCHPGRAQERDSVLALPREVPPRRKSGVPQRAQATRDWRRLRTRVADLFYLAYYLLSRLVCGILFLYGFSLKRRYLFRRFY